MFSDLDQKEHLQPGVPILCILVTSLEAKAKQEPEILLGTQSHKHLTFQLLK